MKSLGIKNHFFLLIFLLLVTTYFPLLHQNLPRIIGSHHFYAALWFFSISLLITNLLVTRAIWYLLFYGLITIFILLNTAWVDIDEWNKLRFIDEFYMLILAVSVFTYLHIKKDFKGYAKLVYWSLIFILITAIMSIYASYIDPLYARALIGSQYDQEQLLFFYQLGAGSYGFAGVLIFLFPFLVYYYRNNEKIKFKKWQIFLFGVICFYALLRMQIVANILVAAFVLIVSILGSKQIKKSIIFAFILLLLFIIIPTSFFADLLRTISTFFIYGSEVNSKLNDLANYLVFEDYYHTGTGMRAERYLLLLKAFFENPLWGFYYSDAGYDISAGGHLYWMNKLTVFGVIGFMLYLKIHISYLNGLIKKYDKEYLFYFSVSVIGGLGLGLIKNLAGREFWYTYFILLPGFYYLPLLKNNSKTNYSGESINKYNLNKK